MIEKNGGFAEAIEGARHLGFARGLLYAAIIAEKHGFHWLAAIFLDTAADHKTVRTLSARDPEPEEVRQ